MPLALVDQDVSGERRDLTSEVDLDIVAQAHQKPGFQVESTVMSFSQSKFETGCAFKLGVELAPPLTSMNSPAVIMMALSSM